MRHAAELAVKEINARGGVRGRPLALRIMDDSGRPDVGGCTEKPVARS